ncbi:hypothetical protein, partial [uncultured Parasutterella sp.]|uniref:hypothetical protein n=1 Tax=uncultured Parasutterella sp. TaxID=1263098 RepID=UPI002675E236
GQWFASGFLQSEPRGSGLVSGYVLGATVCTSGLPPCRVRSCRAHKKTAPEDAVLIQIIGEGRLAAPHSLVRSQEN